MTAQPMLTPYTADEVEDAAVLVAQRTEEHTTTLVGLSYAKAAEKEAREAKAQAFTDWLKARESYQDSQRIGADGESDDA